MHGTLQLPMDVLQAAHSGCSVVSPMNPARWRSGDWIRTVQSGGQYFDCKRQMTWEQVCRYANNGGQKRKRALAALENLLTELDS